MIELHPKSSGTRGAQLLRRFLVSFVVRNSINLEHVCDNAWKGNGGRNQQAATFKLRFTAAAKLIAIIFSSLICIYAKDYKIWAASCPGLCHGAIFYYFSCCTEDPDLLDESSDSDSDDGFWLRRWRFWSLEALSFQTMQDAAQVFRRWVAWAIWLERQEQLISYQSLMACPRIRRTYRYESC